MANTALVSVVCPDRVGLVAAVTGCLFDLGGNLSDTTFAVLGGGAEFTAICELPGGVGLEAVEAELRALPELAGIEAEVTVRAFGMASVHGESGTITHRIVVSGGDRPGLIARLCEVFGQFKANIVRLYAERIPGSRGDHYAITVNVRIPDDAISSCLATVGNTAGGLGLSCRWEAVSE